MRVALEHHLRQGAVHRQRALVTYRETVDMRGPGSSDAGGRSSGTHPGAVAVPDYRQCHEPSVQPPAAECIPRESAGRY